MKISALAGRTLILPVAGVLASFYFGVVSLLGTALWGPAGGVGAGFGAFFDSPTYMAILGRTHLMALCVTFLTVALAYPIAAAMSRSPACAAVMLVIVLLPLFTSIVVRTFGWAILLGPKGLIAWSIRELAGPETAVPKLMYNFFGVLIGLVHILLPFAVLSIYPVRASLPRSMVEASESLGATPMRTFTRVILPLAAPGIFSAFVIVYLIAAGAIVTPLMLGGASNETIGSLIYTNMIRYFDFRAGAVYASVLTLSCAVVVIPIFLADRWVTRHVGSVS